MVFLSIFPPLMWKSLVGQAGTSPTVLCWETYRQKSISHISGYSWVLEPPHGPFQGEVSRPTFTRSLALQGGIPLLAAGQCDAVYACAGLRWSHAAGHRHLPAVGTALLLHGHITHTTLSPAPGHRYTAHSPWACLLDHIDHR